MSLLVYKISKFIKEYLILDRVSFYLPKGSLAALLGPSGSGKSTLLRVLAGLESAENGCNIWLNGRDCTDTPPQHRRMGFVFQNFALFNHMNVIQNISFGLHLRYLDNDEINERVNYLLNALRISDIGLQYPHQLSGGQKQRVALARSLVLEPNFLLLDEPFKALDNELRIYLSKWLKNYTSTKAITTIMVTHNHSEAISMADQIMILKNGHLSQQGSPPILYDNPINPFVGNFLGPFFRGRYIIPSCKLFFRSYETQLTKNFRHLSCLVRVENILYRKHLIEIDLLIYPAWNLFRTEISYELFKQLNIKKNKESLYLSIPRLCGTLV